MDDNEAEQALQLLHSALTVELESEETLSAKSALDHVDQIESAARRLLYDSAARQDRLQMQQISEEVVNALTHLSKRTTSKQSQQLLNLADSWRSIGSSLLSDPATTQESRPSLKESSPPQSLRESSPPQSNRVIRSELSRKEIGESANDPASAKEAEISASGLITRPSRL